MKWQVYGIWLSMFFSIAGLGLIIWKVDPNSASSILKTSFFITLFIMIWSGSTLVNFSFKRKIVKRRALGETADEIIFYDSFLTGLFISAILIAALIIKTTI